MSPLLLETKDIIKLGLSTFLIVPALFIAGFIYGYSKAETNRDQGVERVAIALPGVVSKTVAIREAVVPQSQEPGQDRDVDVADESVDEAIQHQHAETGSGSQTASVAKLDEAGGDVNSEDRSLADQDEQSSSEQVAAANVGGPHPGLEQDPVEPMLDTADEDSARYTVQVGLFADADNAERRVEKLMSSRLNAYTTDFIDKKKRQLFNVRFGYFETKQHAVAALKSFRDLFEGDGYLVRINR